MREEATGGTARPELKRLIAEASQALARLDAARLEELAQSCAALNRELRPRSAAEREAVAREAREAVGEMAVLARVLEATRENLQVMQRLRELRLGRLEYRAAQVDGGWASAAAGGRTHGDD